MIRFLSILFLISETLVSYSQESIVTPKVDERTELLSIVFRIAEADEYMNNQLESYTKDIDQYFLPYKNHEVIKFVKELINKRGVAYDAVMSMATNIEIKEKIKFKGNLTETSLDKRWGQKHGIKFIELLNQFFIDSKFHEFYTNHSSLYKIVSTRFAEILKEVDFQWFQEFFGQQPLGDFNLIISLTNGGANYGSTVKFNDGTKEIYAIIGTWKTDSLGQPVYSKNIISTIIHEYNHSYCNSIIDVYYSQMRHQADKFCKVAEEQLKQQAYMGSKTMLYEILVRACVIRYNQRNEANENRLNRQIIDEQSKGFLWIGQLVNELDIYEKNKFKYPTLKEFMPEIVTVQNGLSPKQLQNEFQSKCAKIVSSNIINKCKNVDPTITEITVRFDKPMNVNANGSSYGKRGKEYFPPMPENIKSQWNQITKMEWSIPVTLKPDTEYSLSFPSQFFKDENLYPLKETYFLDFKTRKK